MAQDIYYRPAWTCGKYNAEKHVAIMFNLLANSEFFFENDSADVINLILKAGRNGSLSFQGVSEELDISKDTLLPFFNTLIEYGLISNKSISIEGIQEYRKQCAELKQETIYIGEKLIEYQKQNIETAELAYMDAVSDVAKIDSVMFELTYRCSEQCLHCYNPGATRNDKEKNKRGNCVELSVDDYKRIIDEFCEEGLVSASLSGGDPFSYNAVWEIVDYLYKKDVAVSIFTNGLKLYDNVEKLSFYFPKEVKLSLYSSLPNVHDSITRVKGSWEKTMDTIAALRKHAIPVTINCIVMRPAVKSFIDIKKIAEQFGCDLGYDVCVTDAIDGDSYATHNLRLTPKELKIVLNDNDVMPISEFDIKEIAFSKDSTPCRAGLLSFCVTPNGDMIPCCAFHLVFGNLTNDSFVSIINNSEVLHRWQKSTYNDYKECFSHDYCSCCTLCPGNNFNEHGTPFKPGENNCYIAKARFSVINSAQEGFDALQGKTVQECLNQFPDYKLPKMQKWVKGIPSNPYSTKT